MNNSNYMIYKKTTFDSRGKEEITIRRDRFYFVFDIKKYLENKCWKY